MKKQIRIFAKEITAKENKFLVYSYTKDGNVFYEIRFSPECEIVPKATGYNLVEIETDTVTKRTVKELDNGFKPNDILWINKVYSTKKDEEYENRRKAELLAELDEIFN